MNNLRKALPLLMLAAVGCGSGGGEEPREASCMDRAIFGAPIVSKYILPFPIGEASEVLQAYCNRQGSHRSQLAYDFIRPFGSDVVAVRGGEVMQVESNHPDFTEDNVHNNIMVRHDDGSTAFYAHLQQDQVFVAIGDFVNAGQVIGLNGSSGTPTACDAHIRNPPGDQCAILHFGVYATWPPQDDNDLAINFRNADGALDDRNGLAADVIYTALSY